MSSWFAGTDVNDIPDNPNELPNNTYKFQVISAQHRPTQDGSKTGITFKYQIIEGAWSTFFPLVDWVRTPDAGVRPDEVGRLLSYLKMRLLAFGFTPEEIQEFNENSLDKTQGRVFYGTTSLTKQDDGKNNIKVYKFDPVDDNVGIDIPDNF